MKSFCIENTTTGCGFGICDTGGITCTCDSGYIHDYTLLRFPNCYLTETIRTASLFTIFGLGALVVLWGLYHVPYTSKLPRKLCMTGILSALFEICFFLSLYLEFKQGPASVFFFLASMTVTICIQCPLFLYTFLSPLLDMMRKRYILDELKKVWIALCIVHTSLSITLFALYIVYNNDDSTWNILLCSYELYLVVYGIFVVISVHFIANRLVRDIDRIRSTISTDLTEYRNTLRKVSIRLKVLIAIGVSLLIIVVSVYLCYGAFPYVFIFGFGAHLAPIFIGFVSIIFAQRQRKQKQVRDEALVSKSTESSVNESKSAQTPKRVTLVG
jgi:hypothetical protein